MKYVDVLGLAGRSRSHGQHAVALLLLLRFARPGRGKNEQQRNGNISRRTRRSQQAALSATAADTGQSKSGAECGGKRETGEKCKRGRPKRYFRTCDILSTPFELPASGGRVLQTGDESFDIVEAAVQHVHVLLVALARRRAGVVRPDEHLSVGLQVQQVAYYRSSPFIENQKGAPH